MSKKEEELETKFNSNYRNFLITEFLFRDKSYQGLSVDQIFDYIGKFEEEPTKKPIRNFLNQLIEHEVVVSQFISQVKYHKLNKDHLTFDNTSTHLNDAEKFTIALLLSFLQHIDFEDFNPVSEQLMSRIQSTYATFEEFNEIRKLSKEIKWSFIELFNLSNDRATEGLKLLENLGKPCLVGTEEHSYTFNCHGLTIRNGEILAVGENDKDKNYFEIPLNAIHQVEPKGKNRRSKTTHIKAMVHHSSLGIGYPDNSQEQRLVFKLSSQFLKTYSNQSMHHTCIVDPNKGEMILRHPISDGLLNWVLSFGGEIIPVEPNELVTRFKEKVSVLHSAIS